MNKFQSYIVALLTFISLPVFADGDFGLEIGFRQQSGEVDSTTASGKSQSGFQVGGTGAFSINGPLYFRTGLLYTQRPLVSESSIGGTDVKIDMNYVDIPLTLMYKFEDYAGVFGGVIMAMNMDSSVDSGPKLRDVKSMIMPIVIGASFKFAPQLGGTIYFETQSGEVAQNLKNYRAVGANLVVTF